MRYYGTSGMVIHLSNVMDVRKIPDMGVSAYRPAKPYAKDFLDEVLNAARPQSNGN